ncbi:unnamed protein product [Prorocentrum cordatum]|uniref:Solute carrier family 40 protein n=1 Tax=Prorocentrum cordatum TaxID=2364126 RepID=A0ABN9YDX9_9DINO|nr:unnamed protein product [Polarella glacialis]
MDSVARLRSGSRRAVDAPRSQQHSIGPHVAQHLAAPSVRGVGGDGLGAGRRGRRWKVAQWQISPWCRVLFPPPCLLTIPSMVQLCICSPAPQAYAVMDVTMGSPPALLRLHRLLLLEAACALVLLPLQAVVWLASFSGRTEVRNMGMLLFIVAVPIAVTALRAPLLVRINSRCSQLVLASELQNAAVATGMVQLLRSDSSRRVWITSAALAGWYAFGVSWNYIGEPCRAITEPIRFWKMKPESAPCECWETICTLLLLANGTLGALILAAPAAVAAFQSRFMPSRSRGIPVRALASCLPEHVIGGLHVRKACTGGLLAQPRRHARTAAAWTLGSRSPPRAPCAASWTCGGWCAQSITSRRPACQRGRPWACWTSPEAGLRPKSVPAL